MSGSPAGCTYTILRESVWQLGNCEYIVAKCKLIDDQLSMREKSHDREEREQAPGMGIYGACVRVLGVFN